MDSNPLEDMEFERPYPLAEVNSDARAKCSRCGLSRVPRPVSELVAIKHRDAHHPAGLWKIYCPEHLPAVPVAGADAPVASRARAAASRAPRAPREPKAAAPKRASKPTPMVDRPPVICPRCFVQVPATGVCDGCGDRVS